MFKQTIYYNKDFYCCKITQTKFESVYSLSQNLRVESLKKPVFRTKLSKQSLINIDVRN